MSLKVFHVFFILLATLMAAGCAAWAFVNQIAPVFGCGCAVVAVALAIYGIYFVKKSKTIIT